jgi:hypothetical protein
MISVKKLVFMFVFSFIVSWVRFGNLIAPFDSTGIEFDQISSPHDEIRKNWACIAQKACSRPWPTSSKFPRRNFMSVFVRIHASSPKTDEFIYTMLPIELWHRKKLLSNRIQEYAIFHYRDLLLFFYFGILTLSIRRYPLIIFFFFRLFY